MENAVAEGLVWKPAYAVRGPVDGRGAPEDIFCRQRPPEVRVVAVVAIVSHHKYLEMQKPASIISPTSTTALPLPPFLATRARRHL